MKLPGELQLWVLCLIGPRSSPTTLICGRYFLASQQFMLAVLLLGDSYPAAKIFVY